VEQLPSIDDPRLARYRNLKDRELARLDGRFIAESDLIVRRLLSSDFVTESVLVASRKAAAIAEVVPASVPMYVLPEDQLDAVIGYAFHTGVLAVGLRKSAMDLSQLIQKTPARSTVVVLPEITNSENLGSLIRIASGFGADAMLLGPRCSDPFYRMSVRVSMGTIFSMPIVRSENLPNDLQQLRERFGYETVATVLEEGAENLVQAKRPDRLAILFGNEAAGLSNEIAAACDRRVTIPMRRGTDSLNVAVAAGIFLYHFTGQRFVGE
jgi:tRNA G18 (ribose-2'-O)-methylase SpoU